MATFFSGQQVGTWSGYALYATLTGDVTRSGNTITLSGLTATFSCNQPWGSDNNFWQGIYDGGSELTRSTGLAFQNQTASKTYNNVSIGVAAADTQHTFNYRTSDGNVVYFTVTFPQGDVWVEPSITSISVSEVTETTAKVTYSVSSWGNPTTGRWGRRIGTTNPPTTPEVIPDQNMSGRLSFTENVTGLDPGTTYYVTAYGWNGQKTGATGYASFKTVDPPKTYPIYVSVNKKSRGVIKTYGRDPDTGKSVLAKKIYASKDGKSVEIKIS